MAISESLLTHQLPRLPAVGGDVEHHLPAGADQAGDVDEARAHIQAGLSGAANSQRGYSADIKVYLAWCDRHSLAHAPLPVASLILYVTQLARGRKYATIQRHVASISRLHRLSEVESPTKSSQFAVFMKGIQRSLKSKKQLRQKQAEAFSLDVFRHALDGLPATPAGRRDKAILLLGFTGAFRREELVQLDVDQLIFDDAGLLIRLVHSKTNQFGEVEEKEVKRLGNSYCPVVAVEAWLADLPDLRFDPEPGHEVSDTGPSLPLFRRIRRGDRVTSVRLDDGWVNALVRRVLGNDYTAHSLRASFVTIAKGKGIDNRIIMNQTKHVTTVMIDRYDRRRNIRDNNASDKLGL